MRIYTDHNGVAVNAIHRLGDGTEVEGQLYQVLAGANVTSVTFQKGNPKTKGVNGLTNEALLAILIHRTTFVNQQFPCEENMVAIQHLKQALVNFEVRTARRMVRGVEGTQTL